METTNNTIDTAVLSLSTLSQLAVGDIFLFFADGYKYVFLGRTSDGFCYKRCEMRSRRKYNCRRNFGVFKIDPRGEIVITSGKIFF